MNIARWLDATGRARPSAPALLHGATLVADYAGFASRAAAVARHLREVIGVMPGDRVALYMANRVAYLEWLYGVLWAGAVVVPVNAKLHAREAAWILDDAVASAVVVDEETGAALAGVPEYCRVVHPDEQAVAASGPCWTAPQSRDWDDLAWLFYTSGTTGFPKGVMLSHGNLIAMSVSYVVDVDTVLPGDAALYAAPLSHGAGMYTFVHVRAGSRHAVPESGRFDADEVLTLARMLGDSSMFAAPTMVRRLVATARARGEDGAGLKTVVYGGGPMYLVDIQEALATMGQRFVQIYGQGESPMTITALGRVDHADTGQPHHLERLASVGRAHSVVDVRVTDDEARDALPGSPGEIEVKGATVMRGYWRNPDATAAAVVGGWLRTGDIGILDEGGYLTLVDRSKDVIVSGGTNVYPREVEEALLAHPSVQEVAVVGAPDREWGEVVVAFVVAAQGAGVDPTELDGHCMGSIARFKRPRRYVVVDSLPKNEYGKVVKTDLRRRTSGDEG